MQAGYSRFGVAGSAGSWLMQQAYYDLTQVRAARISLKRPHIFSPCAAEIRETSILNFPLRRCRFAIPQGIWVN
jgi:hypothetical protein